MAPRTTIATTSSSNKFASANLNKSYGQSVDFAASPSPHTSGRSRLPTQGGMLLLTRPLRSQPSAGAVRGGVKLTAPRPMNLPSLRREHSGNDPTTALVVSSGVSGWSKQQQPGENVRGQSSGACVNTANSDSPYGAGSSTALHTDSTFAEPTYSNQNGELRSACYAPPVGRQTAYIPPPSRMAQVNGASTQLQAAPASAMKAVVLRGEDFPTLQSSLPAASLPPRQKEPHYRQREKRQELKEQDVKFQELSQLRAGNSATSQQTGPDLEPARPMRPQTKSKHTIGHQQQSVSQQDLSVLQTSSNYEKINDFFRGPPPLVRLSHTSNWTDDERETVHSLRPQSDWSARERMSNESCSFELCTLDRSNDFSYGRSSLNRKGLSSGNGKDQGAPPIGKGSGFTSDAWNGRDNALNDFASRKAFSGRASLNSREGRDSSYYWEGSYNTGRVCGKDYVSKLDTSFSLPTGFTNDLTLTRNNGYTKDFYTRMGSLGSEKDRDAVCRQVGPVKDFHRDVPVREGSFRYGDPWVGVNSVRRGTSNGQGKSHSFGKTFGYPREDAVNCGYPREDAVNCGWASSFGGGRIQDCSGYDFGRDNRQSHIEDTFVREGTELRPNFSFGMEHACPDLNISRRKKNVTKDIFWDPERESFQLELEKVQKMLEQERQIMVEKQKRIVELERKEQEDRERGAREEEERQCKLVQEAKEAAVMKERQIVEAAQKLEEERRAWEEEKRKIGIEEQRRKEAARKKLTELEERIARREAEKKRRETDLRRGEERVHRRGMPGDGDETAFHGEPDCDDEYTPRPIRLPYFSAREVSREQNRLKTIPEWKREPANDGNSLDLIPPHYGFLSSRQCEHPCRARFPRSPLSESQRRSMPLALSQYRCTLDPLLRKDHTPHLQEQQQNLNEDLAFSTGHSLSVVNSGYYDSSYDRDMEHNFTRDRQPWDRKGHNLSLPPLSSYAHEVDVADPSPPLRLRQSLPRQPRVLPPPRECVHKPATKMEVTCSLTPMILDDDSNDHQIDSSPYDRGEYIEDSPEKVKHGNERADAEEQIADAYHERTFLHELQPSEQEETVLQFESVVEPDIPSQLSEVDSQESMSLGSPSLAEMQAESTSSDLAGRANEEDVNACSAASDDDYFDSEILHHLPDISQEVSVDDEDAEEDWAAHGYDGAVDQNLENQRLDSLKNDEGATCSSLAKDYSEMISEEQNHRNTLQEEVVNKELLEDVQELKDLDSVEPAQESVELEATFEKSVSEAQDSQLQAAAVEPLLQQGSLLTSNAIETMQLGEPDVPGARPSFIQPIQQPVPFTIMPLSQSNTTAQHSFPGFQNKPEIPFQVQPGLLPGSPVLPNALQFGSIQMPLHLHSQMHQLIHLHGSQAPVLQFGQLGHPALIPQPLPMVQPAMQIHHPFCQATLPPSHQAQTMQQIEGPHQVVPAVITQQNAEYFDQRDVSLSQSLSLGQVEHQSTSEAISHLEIVSMSAAKSDMLCEPVRKLGLKQQAGDSNQKATEPRNDHVSRKAFEDASSDIIVGASPSSSTRIGVGQIQDNNTPTPQSTRMPYVGRKRGAIGRGHERFCNGKAYEGPGFSSESGMWLEARGGGYGRSRLGSRNIHRAEFRVKGSVTSIDGNLTDSAAVGAQQPSQQRTETMGEDVDNQMNPIAQINRASGNDTVPHTGTVVVSHPLESGRTIDPLITANAPEKNMISGILGHSRSSEGFVKKCASPEAPSDTSLQSGVMCVLEQSGVEHSKNEVNFVEVRSKCQMLNDQQEQQEKGNKAKFKDLKEHAVCKQQRFPMKASKQAGSVMPASCELADSQIVERQPPFSKVSLEAVGHKIRSTQHGHASGASQPVLESFPSVTSHLLAPIGTPSCVSDMAVEKRARSVIRVHPTSTMDVTFDDSDTSRCVPCATKDNSSSMAWHDQRSTQQVASFTQFQLEEGMKPVYFGCHLSPQFSFLDRGSMALEPGISVSVVHEKTSAPVPGPISSLLAGQQIQFGAVTSPAVISPKSRPLSPAILDSSFGSSADDVSNFKSQTRHLAGSDALDGDGDATSKNEGPEEGDKNRHVVDVEAEAEAAASAVAVAAISGDDPVGNMHHSSSRNDSLIGMMPCISQTLFENVDPVVGSSGIPTMRPYAVQDSMVEDPMVVALPADLSVDTPPFLFHGNLPNGSSGFVLPSLPSGPSHFPCLEIGTMLGGWQQHNSGGMMDSFYGAPPSSFTGSLVNPMGGIPTMQSPPHMLVYTSPFTPIGNYSQLGMSFMGTAYFPTGKQPDWKHTSVSTSSSVDPGLNNGDGGSNLDGIMRTNSNMGMPNTVQRTMPEGPFVMPAAPLLSPFHLSPAPVQISNVDSSRQWSHVTNQHTHKAPVSGTIEAMTMQPHYSGDSASWNGNLPHVMETSDVNKLANSAPSQSADTVGQFRDELGLVDSVLSNTGSITGEGQRPSSRGQTCNLPAPATSGPSGNKALRGYRSSRAVCGSTKVSQVLSGSDIGTVLLETDMRSLDGRSANEEPCSLQFQSQTFSQLADVRKHPHRVGYANQRGVSQHGAGRVNPTNEWVGCHRKGGVSGRIPISQRESCWERGFPSSCRLKQVYVAKPSLSQKSATHDSRMPGSGACIFSGQEGSRVSVGS